MSAIAVRPSARYDRIPSEFPVLHGCGLTLRELTEDDLPAWFERLSDAEAAGLAGDPVATSIQVAVDGLAHHLEAFRKREALRWSIVPDDSGRSVGSIGLVDFDPAARSASIGAAVGRADWDRGVATDAGRLVIDYAFGPLALHSLEAVVFERNGQVRRVLGKLGFELRGAASAERALAGPEDPSLLYERSRPRS